MPNLDRPCNCERMTDNNSAALDLDPEAFRRYGYEVIDWIADFIADPEQYPVVPPTRPGEVKQALPPAPPQHGEPMERMLADFRSLIVPNTTQWNHPDFFAYFAITGSAPGILGETLAAALNNNAMLWITGQAPTELEEVTLDWLRQMIGLPTGFEGLIGDTASTNTLYALAAARESLGLNIRERGIAGRDLPVLRVYCSEEAHTVTHKSAITLGLGLENVRRIPTDADYRMDVEALRAAIEADLREGVKPLAVVATVGTTSTTAVDPVAAIAEICEQHNIWLHVDAAYGGAAAILPEMRWIMTGCERADSFVVNPHKWLFVPVDCSVLYTRRPEQLRAAFSLIASYLTTRDQARNLMDYGLALGRRFRSLKLWFVLRHFGVEGLQTAIREHIRLAGLFADWLDADPVFERLAPVDFSTVVFRYKPASLKDPAELDRLNAELEARLNASGDVFISHTTAKGRYALRLAIGNLKTTEAHVWQAWARVLEEAQRLSGSRRPAE